MDVTVVHEPTRRRFVAHAGGLEQDVVDFRSTYVDPSLRGHGVGEKLVRQALDWAREEGLKVIPTCWFVDTVVRRHPEYEILLER